MIAETVDELNVNIPIWDSYESALRAHPYPDGAFMDSAVKDVRIESIRFALEALKLVDRSLLKSESDTLRLA